MSADATVPTVVSRETTTLSIDVRADAGAQTGLLSRLSIAALPLSRDRIESREHVVFANQPATPDGSIALTASDDTVIVALDRVPDGVERVRVIAFLQPKANAGKPTLADFHGLTVIVRDQASGRELLRSPNLTADLGPVPALAVADVVRARQDGTADVMGDSWAVTWPQHGYEAGLAGALAQKGIRL